jgi:hypothetical protein
MHDPTTTSTSHPNPQAALPVPAGQPLHSLGHPGGISQEVVAALVDCASGAETAAIEALEAVTANLRRAADARTRLAAYVPPEMLRQVLIARSIHPPAAQPASEQPSGHDGSPS